jgi:peptide/nickel transport system permease protein
MANLGLTAKQFREIFTKVFHNKASKVGFGIVVGILVFISVGRLLVPFTAATAFGPPNEAPTLAHLFGTDYQGHDIFAQVVWGALPTLSLAFIAASGAAAIGFIIGVVSGYYGRIGTITGGATDVVLTFPPAVIIVVVASAFLASNLIVGLLILFIQIWPVARAVRAQVASLKKMVFVEAAKVSGSSDVQVVSEVMMPQTGTIAIAYWIINMAIATILITAVQFLGLGNPNSVTLGSVLYWAQLFAFINGDWWWLLAPGLIITLFAVGLALIGYSVEEVMNPRLRV